MIYWYGEACQEINGVSVPTKGVISYHASCPHIIFTNADFFKSNGNTALGNIKLCNGVLETAGAFKGD